MHRKKITKLLTMLRGLGQHRRPTPLRAESVENGWFARVNQLDVDKLRITTAGFVNDC